MSDKYAIILMMAVVLVVVGLILLSGFIFQTLWNFVLPSTFGWPQLTYWKAMAIVGLIGFLGGLFTKK